MSIRSIVLHMGAHKTGTSLIQKYLRDREKACAKAKIYAMPRGDGGTLIGWGRASEVNNGAERLQAKIMDAESARFKYFILSHENSLGRPFVENAGSLYPHAKKRAYYIKMSIGNKIPFRVVYYIRNQASFIESYYLQTIHEGSAMGFEDFMNKLGAYRFSWAPVYRALCDTFGKENVVLKHFETEIGQGQSEFLRGFLKSATAADLSSFGDFNYNTIRNPSIGDRGLELARSINPHLVNTFERRLFRKVLQENFSNRDFPRPILLDEETKARIHDTYHQENVDLLAASRSSAIAAL